MLAFLRLRAACLLLVLLVASLLLTSSAFVVPLPSPGSSASSSRRAAGAAAGRIVEQRQQQRWQQLDSRLAAPLSSSSATALWAKKNKESDVIEVDGIVKESLPNAKFRVELVATKAIIVCSTSGKMRKNFVRVLVGDPVKVELSPYDLTRGRITYRSRGPPKGGAPGQDSSPPPPPPPAAPSS